MEASKRLRESLARIAPIPLSREPPGIARHTRTLNGRQH